MPAEESAGRPTPPVGALRGPPDLLAWRAEMPVVDRKVFLGVHTLAPLSRRVRGAVDRFLDTWEEKASAERVWFDDVIPEMRRLEANVATLLGADPDEIVLTPSVSTGLSSIASAVDLSNRREVVVSRQEFPTDTLVWLAQERRGADVVWADGRDADALLAAVGAGTAVVSASRVSYLDGTVLDVQALAAGCRAAGARCVLDDYHGTGVVPIDVHDIGCDVVVGGPLKYLLGGPGIAFLYVRRGAVADLQPTVTGWFAQRDFFAFDGSRIDWPPSAQRFAMGTPSPAAIFAAAAGLDIVLEVGVERIRRRVLELTDHLIARAEVDGFHVRTPREHERRGGLVVFDVPESKRTLDRLLDEGVVVDERHGALRAAPHFWSSEDDVDALFDALGRLGVRPDSAQG